MQQNFVHVSDVHFEPHGFEKRPAVGPFLDDLRKTVATLEGETFLVFSGDVAQSGADEVNYDAIFELLDPLLVDVGIPRQRRICVPGNHDVSRQVIESALIDHEGVISMRLSEDAFNSYVEAPSAAFSKKFENYLRFENRFAAFGISGGSLGGAGHSLNETVGVYCANTALLSSGGVMLGGVRVSDHGRLALATAPLAAWLSTSKHAIRLFVGHHPIGWMNDWSQREACNLFEKFAVVFTGHDHEQDSVEENRTDSRVLRIAAPALLTDKRDPMGYSVLSLVNKRKQILYRQWDRRSKFVLGTLMSRTDSGVVEFPAPDASGDSGKVPAIFFAQGLNKTLQVFGKRNLLEWVEPQIFDRPEVDRGRSDPHMMSVEEIVRSSESYVVKAPPQFGLSSLGWQLCKVASEIAPNDCWLRLDLSESKPHDVREDLRSQLALFGATGRPVACIVVDSWNRKLKNAENCIKALKKEFPEARLVILETELTPSLGASSISLGNVQLKPLFLWAFGRQGMRAIVSAYCSGQDLDADVEALLGRVLQDLHALNLPRTPLNCFTILMVSAAEGDPLVNRAEVIRGILTVVFQSEVSLTYRSRADLKDCEHLLGAFAEKIIRCGDQFFTKADFLAEGKRFCEQMLVDVDVRAVLQLLVAHDIVVGSDESLSFRFSYWIYYFAAARMHHDDEFRRFVLSEMQYTRFPEVIEFYAGIDRCRADALTSLSGDLRALSGDVESKTQLSSPERLYALFNWNPQSSDAEKMMKHLEGEVLKSSLPQDVKDQFADQIYDSTRPYDQRIKKLLERYSFDNLCAGLRASARALRNSDYVEPRVKEELLDALLVCWEQVQSVLVVISPMLADNGEAVFDGTRFVLDQELKAESTATVAVIWNVIPFNVLSWFRDDLTSSKLGPLLYKRLASETDAMRKHNVALLIAAIRPPGWVAKIEDYVAAVGRNSFYLYDLATFLTLEFKYAYLNDRGADEVSRLVKLAYSKHLYGKDRPSDHQVKAVNVPALAEDRDTDRS